MNSELKFWRKTAIVITLVLFAQIISPFAKSGMPLGHDSQLNLTYTQSFLDALSAGQFPVRFTGWSEPGLNSPLFNFYQPGLYYMFVAPMLLGIPKIISLKIVIILTWYLSAFFMFLFTKRHFGTLSALVAAYFYLIAPYHILDVFIRAALSEFIALSFIPAVFWGLKAYFDTGRGFYLTIISFAIAAVILTHPPTMIMFSPLIAGYLLFLFYWQKSPKTMIALLTAITIGFGITSFFLLPGFVEQKYIQTIFMRSGYYDFHHHFVCYSQLFSTVWAHGTSLSGCGDLLSFQLGIVHWFTTGATVFILLVAQTIKVAMDKKTKTLLVVFLAGLLLSLLMTLEISKLLWEFLPYLEYIQYPWRFLAVAIFTSSFIAASLLTIFKKEVHKIIVFIVLIAAATIAYSSYLKPQAYATEEEINFGGEILHDSVSGVKVLTPEPGYMPKWTQALPAEDDRPKEEIKIATESASLGNYSLTAHKKIYEVEVRNSTTAKFYTHYFPGWKVHVDGQNIDAKIDNVYGYIGVDLTPGRHTIELTFENTPVRTFANLLSVNFAVVGLFMAVIFNRKVKNEQ